MAKLPAILFPTLPDELPVSVWDFPQGVEPCEVLYVMLMEYFAKERGCGLLPPDPRHRLRRMNKYIQAGDPLPNELRLFFQQAIEANDLNKSFGFKTSKLRNDLERISYDRMIYRSVNKAELPLHTGGAFPHVGEMYHKSPEAIAKSYYSHKHRFEEFCARDSVQVFCRRYEKLSRDGELM